MALLVWHCSLSQLPDQPPKNSKAVYPLIINNYQIELQICFFSLKRDRDTWLFLCVCASVCTYMCVSARFAMWVFVTLSPTKRIVPVYWAKYILQAILFFFQSRKCDVKEDTREGVSSSGCLNSWFTLVLVIENVNSSCPEFHVELLLWLCSRASMQKKLRMVKKRKK